MAAVAVQTYLLSVAELVELEELAAVVLEKDLEMEMLELLILVAVAVEQNMTLPQVAVVLVDPEY